MQFVQHILVLLSFIIYIMINYLTFFTFSLIIILSNSVILSPFDYSNIYPPANLYRMSYSATLTGTSSTFTVSYPSSFTAIPFILYSISSLTFKGGVKYDLSITNTTTSVVKIQLAYDSTLTKVSLLFLAMDSTLYNVQFNYFTYTIPNGVNSQQTFVITGHQNHDASFLISLYASQGPISAGYAPTADSFILVDTSSIISANLSITFDPSQLTISKFAVYFVDFQTQNFKAKPYAGIGQQFTIFGTNGFATDTTQTGSYLSAYPSNYFIGLQTIYDGQFLLGTLSFDIISMINTNLLFIAYKCPGNFPYIDSTRTYCYTDCDIGFYGDNQYICQPCDPNCYTCFNTSKNCTSCISPYQVIYGYVCGCNQQTYQLNHPNGTVNCLPCSSYISGCKQCISSTHCTLCMNNLILTTPLLCLCPVDTTTKTLGSSNVICVQTISLFNNYTSESCPDNFIINETICYCPNELNLTFTNGVCQ